MSNRLILKYRNLPRQIKIGLWLAAALILYTIIGFWVIPPVTKYILESKLPQVLHRPVHVEKVYFNPFTLDLRIDAFDVGRRDGKAHLAKIKEIEVNLQAISVIKRALVLSSIKIRSPQIFISQNKKGVFNFNDILEGSKEEKSETESKPFLFSLNNIEISHGEVIFRDELKGVRHAVKNIKIGIPFISNLKTRIKIYTKPYFSAVINGAPVEFKGETRPFAQDRSTRLHVKLSKLDLAHYLAYLSDFIDFKIDSGFLGTDFDLVFVMAEDGTQDIELDGNITVSSLSMSKKGKEFLKVKRVNLAFAPSNLLQKRIWFSRISVEQPKLEIQRNESGVLNLATLIPARNHENGEKNDAGKKARKAMPLDFRIARAVLSDGFIHVSDHAAGSGTFDTNIQSVNILLNGFGTLKKEPAEVQVFLNTGKGGKLSLQGKILANPLSVDMHADLNSLDIPSYAPYYQRFLNAKISKGQSDISTKINLSMNGQGGPSLMISDLHVLVADFELKDPSAPDAYLVRVPSVELSGGKMDLAARDINISSISIDGVKTNVIVDKAGQVNLGKIVKGSDSGDIKNEDADGKAFHFSLDDLSLKKANCRFQDLSGPKPVLISVSDVGLNLHGIDNDPAKRSSFDLSARIGKKGVVSVKGGTDFYFKQIEAAIDIKRLGLRQFQGYVSRFSNARLYKGRLYFRGKVDVKSASNDQLRLAARGNCSLSGVSILSPHNHEPVFQWKMIEARGIDFLNQPFKLSVKKVILDRMAGNIIFDDKGNLNVLNLMKGEGSSQNGTKAPKHEKDSAQDIRIQVVSLKDCALEIVDDSVKPPFVRSIKQINGQIKGLSSDPKMKAQLEIKGLADNSASMEVKGEINPLAKPVFADLTFKSNGIGMTRFSPYTAKFLGYVIDKGKLSSEVHLKIEDEKITAENRLFLDQFDFGHSIESKDAVHLPVKLAIALLKDRHGQINVDIPVSGRLDDPKFSLGGAILKAIINIFVKAATSPFSLLSAIAGGGEDMQHVVFEPGSNTLTEEAKKKLSGLAKALKDRPSLKVELTGFYDPVVDAKGLKELRFMRLLKSQKMKDLEDEEREKIQSVDDIGIGKDEFNKYLKEAYKDAPFDKPRMIIGLLKKQPPEVMEKMLRDHIKITQGDLENLALERAQAVQNYLIGQGGIEASRIFLTSSRHVEKGKKGSMVKLSLK